MLKNFLEIPYDELEEMNLKQLPEAEYREYLKKEKSITKYMLA